MTASIHRFTSRADAPVAALQDVRDAIRTRNEERLAAEVRSMTYPDDIIFAVPGDNFRRMTEEEIAVAMPTKYRCIPVHDAHSKYPEPDVGTVYPVAWAVLYLWVIALAFYGAVKLGGVIGLWLHGMGWL